MIPAEIAQDGDHTPSGPGLARVADNLNESQRALVEQLAADPQATQRDIARALSVSQQGIHRRLARLRRRQADELPRLLVTEAGERLVRIDFCQRPEGRR